MEEIFQSGIQTEKVSLRFREKLLRNLLRELENMKVIDRSPALQLADIIFLISLLASIGITIYGIIISEQAWINLIQ